MSLDETLQYLLSTVFNCYLVVCEPWKEKSFQGFFCELFWLNCIDQLIYPPHENNVFRTRKFKH